MVPRWGTLILLVVASGDAALLNRAAQRLSARRVRDALIARWSSQPPTLAEPERVDTYVGRPSWRRVLEAGRELRVDTYWRRDDSELSQRLARMLEATPSLQRPTRRPKTPTRQIGNCPSWLSAAGQQSTSKLTAAIFGERHSGAWR